MKVTFFFKTDLFDNIISYESYVMKDNNFCSSFFSPEFFQLFSPMQNCKRMTKIIQASFLFTSSVQ